MIPRAVMWVALAGAFLAPSGASGAEALVAVATNFAGAMTALESAFERDGAHRIRVATGSTGALYAQVTQGAPFDLLLAADRARPERLEAAGHAAPGSRRTYAIGRLVLWSADAARVTSDGVRTLHEATYRKLAIANPELAPYGRAARDMLQALELYEGLRKRIVMGENVGQAHALVATGNAELGLVALSQVMRPGPGGPGSRWDVPPDLHTPIRQDAVLLRHGAQNPAAAAFLRFLFGPGARDIIEAHGYRLPPADAPPVPGEPG